MDYHKVTIGPDPIEYKTVVEIIKGTSLDGNELVFVFTDGTALVFYHKQDCCECVHIEDIEGDLNDLIGTPLLKAEVVSNTDPGAYESATWTFYKFATAKGYVTVRWYGTSNGYYSEEVDQRLETWSEDVRTYYITANSKIYGVNGREPTVIRKL